MNISKWLELINNKLEEKEIFIHDDYLKMLSPEDVEAWIIRQEDAPDYYNYYFPLN